MLLPVFDSFSKQPSVENGHWSSHDATTATVSLQVYCTTQGRNAMTKSAGGMLSILGHCVLILFLLGASPSPCIASEATRSTRRHKIVVTSAPNTTASFVPPARIASTQLLTNAATTKAKTLRVCVLVEPSPFSYCSGYSNRFQQLLSHLESRQDDVQIVTAEIVHTSPPKQWLGFPVHYTAGIPLPYYPIMSLSTDIGLKIARVIARMRPDLIHASSPGSMVAAAVIWARLFQIPLISSYHTHVPVYMRSYLRPKLVSRIAEHLTWIIIRLVHSMTDLTIVTSSPIQTEFHQHGINAQVWQKGIDTQRFHPRYASTRMRKVMTDGNENDFLMLYVGRLANEKRLKDIKAMLERMPNARLCMVGHGPQEEQLKEYFKGTKTVFTGHLSGTELSEAFASADVFVMPSDSETLGFVVMESMASGVPVVAARAGGIPDMIDDGVSGFLVETGNTKAFVERLQLLEQNPVLRRQLSLQGRKNTEEWTWSASMGKLRDEQYKMALKNFHDRFEQRLWRLLTFKKKPSTCKLDT